MNQVHDLQAGLTAKTVRDNRLAMRLSLGIGLLMLAGKGLAYYWTGSSAIFSDAAESVVHVFAVGFAAFSLWLSLRPANPRFTFGFERISFFSAGFEGAMIILAALTIFVTSIQELRTGVELARLSLGTSIVALAALVNAFLGWYLLRTGRRTNSLILEANGTHVLTDTWTSVGVVGGLCLVQFTDWLWLDPVFAMAVAVNILWSGGKLIYRSVGGLMDYVDSGTGGQVRQVLDRLSRELGVGYHGLRFRNTGFRLKAEMHLLFPAETPLGQAHRIATQLEHRLPREVGLPMDVTTHLEAVEDHAEVHEGPLHS